MNSGLQKTVTAKLVDKACVIVTSRAGILGAHGELSAQWESSERIGRKHLSNVLLLLLLLLLLSRFSRVQLCATPQTAAQQASPSLGFSRQEYWNGLPFPSPMHACMLSRFSRGQVYATLGTAAHQAPLSTRFSRQEYWSGLPLPFP